MVLLFVHAKSHKLLDQNFLQTLQIDAICSKDMHIVFWSWFLTPLNKGQRAVVMALCPSWVRKLFLQKTSPRKLLTGF